MSISIRQIFPPAAKFTEKNLADQTGKVRKSAPRPHNYHCRRFPSQLLSSYIIKNRYCFALKCYSVLPDSYPSKGARVPIL